MSGPQGVEANQSIATNGSGQSLPTFAQIHGNEPSTDIIKTAKQAKDRGLVGDPRSNHCANANGEACTGSTAPPQKNAIDHAIDGMKDAGDVESKGILADSLKWLGYHSDSDDPEADAEARQSDDYKQLSSRLGQEYHDLPGNMVTGAGKILSYIGEGQIASDPNIPENIRTAAQNDLDKTNKAIGDSIANPVKEQYKKGGLAQAIPYIAVIGTAEAGKLFATDGLGDAAKVADGVEEIGAASKVGSAGADATKLGEPVSVATGEYLETWRDFIVPGAVLDGARFMGLKLHGPANCVSPLGACQISSFDEIISNPRHGQLDFHQADGKVVRFDRPFNFLPSHNAAYPHLDLRAPRLKRLELRTGGFIKHFRQHDDDIYRLNRIEDLNGNALVFVRDEAGILQRVDSTDGLALAFTNDVHRFRTSVTLIGTDGSRLDLARYTYDVRGRMTEANCRFGMSVRYFWHPERDLLLSWHNLTKRSETHFTYDNEGRVLHTRTNGIWNDDRFRYDPTNRETTYLPSGADQLAQRFRYDENDNVTHEIDALGGILQHTFDAAGFETATIDANGHASSTTYDTRGNVKRHVDAEGRGTTYGWGPHGELDVVIDGEGHIRKYENDEKGNCLAETDAEGHTTRYVRDERGRLLRTILPDGAEESRAYGAHGRLVSLVDARGGTTRFAHDAFGRVVETTDALGHVTRTEYTAGAGGFATPSAIVRPDGVRIQRAFTEDGVLASVTDGEGRTWAYTYGAFDVLQAIEDPGGGRLSFAYDGEGRVISVTNQMGVTYHLIRDVAGRVIAEEDFDGRRTEYTRDPADRVVETKKPDGVRLAYGYDRTDKLTSIRSYAADADADAGPLDETHFWYDGRGLLIKASNLAALVEFVRDGNGRIIRETVNGRTVESKLDARGNRIERRIGASEIGAGLVQIARDPLGMVASIAIDHHALLAFSRDALGRETRRASAAGFRLDQTWDAVGQLMTQSAGHGSVALDGLRAAKAAPAPGTDAQRRYAWDKASAPVGIDDMIWGATRYDYDANGQVAKARFGDDISESFAYDAAKNVVGVKLEGPQHGAGLGALLSWRSTQGGVVQLARGPHGESIALTHDVCGRVVERRVERKGFRPKTWRYGWDAHDRLVRCDNPEGETWFYRYDPFGRRLTKVRKLADKALAWTAQKHAALVPAAAREATKIWTWPEPPAGSGSPGDTRPPIVGTHFLWDGDVVAEEAPLRLDGTVEWADTTRWHFEPDGFRPLAKQAANGTLLNIVNDHLGTPREMFDEGGHLRWTANYTTWGVVRGVKIPPEPANDDGSAIYPRGGGMRGNLALKIDDEARAYDCSIRFPGQWYDEESGLAYNRNRYYDASVGQYTAVDPIGLNGGPRPQSYVDCPSASFDPLGWSAAAKDALGRTTSYNNAVGPNDIGTGTATNQAARDFARGRGNPTDDAGHALGRNLGGSGTDLENIFPQSITVNRGAFRAFEQQIAKRVKNTGQTAQLKLAPSYAGDSFRPTGLTYSARFSDGTSWVRSFPNP